jgi:hypothetical protein
MSAFSSRPMPLDQAYGLRRLFAHTQLLCIPVVSNPHVAFGGVMLERLCAAFTMLGKRTLVIDAAERSPEPDEIADIDLSACIEPLSSDVFYLAGRGLPLRYVDSSGSTAPFLEAVAQAAPQAEVALVHANAVDMCRLFSRSAAKPLLLADDHPNSVTHAYAGMKLLTHRADLKVYDLLLCVDPESPRADRIAAQLAACAEDFFGGVVRQSVLIDPASAVRDAPTQELLRWAYLAIQAAETDWDKASVNALRSGSARHERDGMLANTYSVMN